MKFAPFGVSVWNRGCDFSTLNFNPEKENGQMDTSKLVPVGIALGICYAVSKFVANPMVKAAAYGVAGVVVAKQIPYLQNVLA